jgi:hypothetical protein
MCEEGGADNPTYGFYGIYPSTWQAYGGAQFASTAGGATQAEQVQIGMAIEGHAPDQGSCEGAW